MRVALISPYHGGSHAAWGDGWAAASRHDVTPLVLPARFWKWRMHGGAVTLARRFRERGVRADVLLVTDMLDLTTFLALTREHTAGVPVVMYLHENQLTYPLPDRPDTGAMRRQGGARDLHYAFVNWASMLAADRVVFNSEFHRRSLLEALPAFLRHFPEHNELGTVDRLMERSSVLPVGIDLAGLTAGEGGDENAGAGERGNEDAGAGARGDDGAGARERGDEDAGAGARDHEDAGAGGRGDEDGDAGEPPLVLWNQRWEYDKNPGELFEALFRVADAGVDFRLALCGERFGRHPPEFDAAAERLGHRIVQFGHATRHRYLRLLAEATVVVSTAHHEFFGVGVVEAVACSTFPLLPRRLAYPELLPSERHEACLYDGVGDLVERLCRGLASPGPWRRTARELAPTMGRYDWPRLASRYDDLLASCVRDR